MAGFCLIEELQLLRGELDDHASPQEPSLILG
jgi:hypothetical protein